MVVDAAEYEALVAQNRELKAMVATLTEKVGLLTRSLYAPKTEKTIATDEQPRLFNEAEVEAGGSDKSAGDTADGIKIAAHTRTPRRGHTIDYDLLEREVEQHTLEGDECICPTCSGTLHDMGYDSSFEVRVIPRRLYLHEDRYHKYACRTCQKDDVATPILMPAKTQRAFSGSIASASLVSHITCNKYHLHLPLYRQEADLKSQGIEISRQTMANWVIAAAEWIEPLWVLMREELIGREVLHADETTLEVLKSKTAKNSSTRSYMWVYLSDAEHPLILYDWQKSRATTCAKQFLGDFSGYLHTDGYEAYHKLDHITNVGCWAHARRKFDEALKIIDVTSRAESVAAMALAMINRLFALEREYTDRGLDSTERYEARLTHSKPVMDELFEYVSSAGVLPKSTTGKACAYALGQRPYLENVLLDGRLELSNNVAERAIKPFVIGRKNWLFANTPKGARASATLFSIIESAKANGLVPEAYLTWLLETLPNITTDRLPELLPYSESLPSQLHNPA